MDFADCISVYMPFDLFRSVYLASYTLAVEFREWIRFKLTFGGKIFHVWWNAIGGTQQQEANNEWFSLFRDTDNAPRAQLVPSATDRGISLLLPAPDYG